MNEPLQKLALPDLWQQEAVRALKAGQDVVVDAPTGAGKTRIFELYLESGALRDRGQAVFTVPTRALANDKWSEWTERGWKVGIATGDLAENLDAPVVVATLETQRDRFLRGRCPALLVVDEYQMISDAVRGAHYELALALAPKSTQLLLLSGSVGNPERVAEWLSGKGRSVSVVRAKRRPVPLDNLPIESLPRRAPLGLKGFFPRLAAEALMADLGPLLIFVPRRQGAESIARAISEALPEPDPLELTVPQEQVCGKALARMLRRRVAYHHSGLGYDARAGLVEPLARAGQLRVIVATMGLAAGINFSVRSVFVAETSFHDGPFLRRLRPDELLQMFGRAGRRGKDEAGFVLHGDETPSLADARARDVRRANEVDWPTLLRVMHHAVEEGRQPFAAATEFCRGLFSNQPISLGVEGGAMGPTQPEMPSFGLGPTRREILNADGEWEPRDRRGEHQRAPLAKTFVHERERWIPALRSAALLGKRGEHGRVTALTGFEERRLGKEIVVANRGVAGGWWPVRSLAETLNVPRNHDWTEARFRLNAEERLRPGLGAGRIWRWLERGGQLILEIDYGDLEVDAYRDSAGRFLLAPPERVVSLARETEIMTGESDEAVAPPPQSPAHAWRELGLIEADGRPTRRGLIFSFFHHGEGLAVAAALEQADYEVDELVWHLANVRGGYRFEHDEGGESERLAIVCRQTYGPVNHEGYLCLGLPLQYGEGAAESLRHWLERHGPLGNVNLGRGDMERALREWMSLLRQISHAEDVEWDRWRALKQAAAERLRELEKLVPPAKLSRGLLHAKQKLPYHRHRLRAEDFRGVTSS